MRYLRGDYVSPSSSEHRGGGYGACIAVVCEVWVENVTVKYKHGDLRFFGAFFTSILNLSAYDYI